MKKIRGVPKGGVTVWLQRGIYEISKTFELNDTDSGTVESPVVYRSVPGEQVRLVGGRQIPSSAFKPATNPDVLNSPGSVRSWQRIAGGSEDAGNHRLWQAHTPRRH